MGLRAEIVSKCGLPAIDAGRNREVNLQLIKFGVNYHLNPMPAVVTARY